MFELGGIQKNYSMRRQISRSKARYIVFQHKLLFDLNKYVCESIGGLGGV